MKITIRILKQTKRIKNFCFLLIKDKNINSQKQIKIEQYVVLTNGAQHLVVDMTYL
jgi:hypothetical protein